MILISSIKVFIIISTMSRFIKLTSAVINASHVTKILNYNNKYYIHMSDKHINGFMFISSGSLSSQDHIIEVCENKHNIDYIIVKDWIKNI